jgi:hypothetical protein
MKGIVLAVLLPVAVAGGAWLLTNELSEPAASDRPADDVPPFVAVDSSQYGNDGIIEGAVVTGLPGRYGTSYTFVQRGSWIQVPSVPEINPGTRDFLLSAWVRFDEFSGPGETYDVVRKGIGYTTPGEFRLEVLPGGSVSCTANGASGVAVQVISAEVIPDDAWHLIGCARTGSSWSVLIDDTLSTKAVALGEVANTVPLAIGSKYGLEDRPPCRVDDVKLVIAPFDDPTSTGTDVSEAIRALEGESPAGWWRLDEAAPSAASGR